MNTRSYLILIVVIILLKCINSQFVFPFARRLAYRGGFARTQVRPRLALGVRDAIFAINAFCDDSCASDLQQQQVSNCVQNGINNGAQIVNILRSCSPGPDISCNRQQRPRTNRCLIQRTVNRRNLMNRRLQRCFRTTVSLATIDCLTNKYRILRTLLPIPPGPPGSVVTSN